MHGLFFINQHFKIKKHNMKKMILGLAAIVTVTCSIAQQKPDGGQHKGQHPGMEQRHRGADFSQLNLTDAQQQQIKAVKEDFRKQMQELNSKETITVKEQRDQRAALVKAQKSKMEAILTADQKNELAKIKAENANKRAEMEAKRLEKMKEKLSLSDAQVATIKSAQQQTHSKIDALLKDESIDRTDKKQQLTALRQEMKTNMEKVLTSDQKIKLEEWKKENQQNGKSFKGHRMSNDAVK